jgi:type II secretory pathway pseudopilin PulG
MKNIKAFTFIELIVCVSIIMVTSVFAVSSFSDFLNGREGNIRVGQFSDYIKGLDNKVMNKDIFNYKIVLDTALK